MPNKALIVACVTCVGFFVVVADSAQPTADPRKKQFAEMSAKSGLPIEQHKPLAAFVGDFDQISEVHPGPGDPLHFHATGKGAWVMGERFVRLDSASAPDEEVKGERMHVFGYDPAVKKYTLWGIETGSLTSYSATGDYDASSKTFTFDGTRDGPGGAKMPFRMKFVITDGGVIKQTLSVGQPGGPGMEVDVTHTPIKHQ